MYTRDLTRIMKIRKKIVFMKLLIMSYLDKTGWKGRILYKIKRESIAIDSLQ